MDPITNIARQCHLKLGGRHVRRLAVQGSHTVRNSLVPKGKKTSGEYGCREGGQASSGWIKHVKESSVNEKGLGRSVIYSNRIRNQFD